MAETFPALTDRHRAFIEAQPMFFVATAAAGARVNVSPKGMDSFRVLNANTVAYLDLGGSGNETGAHLLADGRITIMFCAFDQPALILRLYGRGAPVLPQDEGWGTLAAHFPPLPGVRQIFRIAVDRVQTSCGWGVPLMTLDHERETLAKYHRKHGGGTNLPESDRPARSIDGLAARVPSVALG